jgi:hypothetical protein
MPLQVAHAGKLVVGYGDKDAFDIGTNWATKGEGDKLFIHDNDFATQKPIFKIKRVLNASPRITIAINVYTLLGS